jgi:hypothetical protein
MMFVNLERHQDGNSGSKIENNNTQSYVTVDIHSQVETHAWPYHFTKRGDLGLYN